MDPENHTGNREYKLKLVGKDEKRLEELKTQMVFRCNEGNGECFYNLGVKDNGECEGIIEEEFTETINNINAIAEKNNYSVTLLSSNPVSENKKVYEVLIRENNDKYIDVKVVVAGAVDASKSTFIGTLITGKNDDGRGLARSSVFNYEHELKSGRTSSIAHHILGFDASGKIVNYEAVNRLLTWSDIVKKSKKVISFFDLAGHEKYLRTTIMGLSSFFPDICFIMVSANNGVSRITKEHIFLCITLKIPFIIVISKIDICEDRKNVLSETTTMINNILKAPGIRRIPLRIKSDDDVIISATKIYSETVVPIFRISNVTGVGLDYIKKFLNIVGKKNNKKEDGDPVEYHIDNVFNVYGFGLVVGGNLLKGTVKVGDKLFLGPNNGEYQTVVVKTIQCKRVSVQEVSCGSYVCIGLKKKIPVRRGNVLVSNTEDKLFVKTFVAEINVLKSHSTTIKVGYEPILHTSSLRQTVKILNIKEKKNLRNEAIEDDIILRSGDSAIVTFEFKYNYQFLRANTRLILCEGMTKIVGSVISIN